MSDKSGIEWTDATWNPVTGCAKVSQGCKNCYAKRDWARLAAMPGTVYHGRAFEDVQCHPERLDIPLRWKKPRRVFVNSMSDLFHESVPDEFIAEVFGVMACAVKHTFQVLTKRPDRMLAFLSRCKNWGGWITHNGAPVKDAYDGDGIVVGSKVWPLPNVWLGVSVEDQATADERIPLLIQTPAAVRWISAEPLLGPIDLFQKPACLWEAAYMKGKKWPIHWVVAGGESGPNARPMHPDWARSLRDQCIAAGVPYFFKQWGEWAPTPATPVRGEYVGGGIFLRPNGDLGCQGEWWDGLAQAMDKVGKRTAGRILDGRTWDEYPK